MKKDTIWSADELLNDILEQTNQVASESSLNKLLDRGLNLILDVCDAQISSFFTVVHTSDKLVFKTAKARGHNNDRLDEIISTERTLADKALQAQQIISIEDINNPPPDMLALKELSIWNIKNTLAYPLRNANKIIGILLLYNYNPQKQKHLEVVLTRLASEIDKALIIENREYSMERLKFLIGIMGQIGASLDREQILRMIIENARELLNTEACSLFLVDEDSSDIVLKLASNADASMNDAVEEIRVPTGHGIIGYVVQTGETVIVDNVSVDKRHYINVDQTSGFDTKSILAVPLFARTVTLGGERGKTSEKIIGGIEAVNKIEGDFTDDDNQLLRTLASQAATVLEIARLYADSNELFLDVVKALTTAIDAKDPYTEGHSKRVSEFSVEIAREIQIPDEAIQHVRIGSLLHDVGKIGIPDSILHKSGRLNDIEYDKMKEHPAIGARIMGQVQMLANELPAMAEHHERLDGSGYPAGLNSNSVSLYGKVVAVADVFDAMTSDRPYRQALSVKEAFEYLKSGIGTHFDENCVDALIRAYQKNRIRPQRDL